MKYIDGITIPWRYRTDVGPTNWSSNVTLIVTGLGLLVLIIGVVVKVYIARWNDDESQKSHNESQESDTSSTNDEGGIFGALISLFCIVIGTTAFALGGSVWIYHQCKSAATLWTAWVTWVNPHAIVVCVALVVVWFIAIIIAARDFVYYMDTSGHDHQVVSKKTLRTISAISILGSIMVGMITFVLFMMWAAQNAIAYSEGYDHIAIMSREDQHKPFAYIGFDTITESTGVPIAPMTRCEYAPITKPGPQGSLSDDGACAHGNHREWPIKVPGPGQTVSRDILWVDAQAHIHSDGIITVDSDGHITLYDNTGALLARQDPAQVLKYAQGHQSLHAQILSGFNVSSRDTRGIDRQSGDLKNIPADWNAGIRNNLVTAGIIRDGQSHIRRVWMFDIGGYVWLSDVHANEPQISVALDQPVVLDQQEKGDG